MDICFLDKKFRVGYSLFGRKRGDMENIGRPLGEEFRKVIGFREMEKGMNFPEPRFGENGIYFFDKINMSGELQRIFREVGADEYILGFYIIQDRLDRAVEECLKQDVGNAVSRMGEEFRNWNL
jgi:alpha-mannosidase